ncbi:M64 family metallopeptidase [Kitasatospora griseola]|uniref:M64 family metallopeptidase n=1 Tax=Kitasatospora griseola TaxID=2064 RepID=UPI0016712DA7|nr:M64 family metallopeptidase [Kitasatospora griseola]GGQ54167.1 hypothetical protein GCM10010195_07010 [Kitasatospora griseola]
MAVPTPDLLLFPHCDLHLALTGAPPLTVTLATREVAVPMANGYTVTAVPPGQCVFEFFAPFKDKGHRFDGLPTYDNTTGRITATTPGVFLFQAHVGTQYLVGRLQVHRSVVGWWFGNDSITTALDTTVAHAQPSLYAKFSDDAGAGTDLIGDITGHGYVQLVPADARQLAVSPTGRLRGVLPTQPGAPWVLSGLFPGLGGAQLLNVWVVDYAAQHALTSEAGGSDPATLADKHNVLFLAEGFREQDRAKFDALVTRAIHEMFEKPAHEPYGMLRGGFNVFKSFTASQQHTVTCGYRVAAGEERIEAGQAKGTGFPIPSNQVGGGPVYTLEELVRRVGLPMRGDQRTNLVATWQAQDLDIDPAKITDGLVNAWKQHQSVGILHARDTFFGLRLGQRLADRFSGNGPVAKPAADTVGDPGVKAFVARLYEFYRTRSTRNLVLDPRRHPPELYMDPSELNPATTLMRYVGSLKVTGSPAAVGAVWQPDDQKFQPSRGLVALIANDGMDGGTNFNVRTVTAQTVNTVQGVAYVYANATDKRELRRDPPADTEVNFDEVIDTVSHEFGHSFNLLDEYEEFRGDGGPDEERPDDPVGDNVSRLGFLRVGPAPDDRHIDPGKVKWFQLPRISTAAALLANSVNVTSPAAGIKLTIGTRNTAEWQQVQKLAAEVRLRNFGIAPGGQQLPLDSTPAHYLEGLSVAQVLPGEGAIVLTKAGTTTFPTFQKGSIVFVPLKDKQHQPLMVVEPEVLAFLRANHNPLNQDTNHNDTNPEEDNPVDIPDFSPPCKSARTIGIYEGADTFAGAHYRPTGRCKMRMETDFCHVCAWLIVNRVDPTFHALLDRKFYPESKAEKKKHE